MYTVHWLPIPQNVINILFVLSIAFVMDVKMQNIAYSLEVTILNPNFGLQDTVDVITGYIKGDNTLNRKYSHFLKNISKENRVQKFNRFLDILNDNLRQSPDDLELLALRGNLYFSMKQFNAALCDSKKLCHELRSKDPRDWFLLGNTHLFLNSEIKICLDTYRTGLTLCHGDYYDELKKTCQDDIKMAIINVICYCLMKDGQYDKVIDYVTMNIDNGYSLETSYCIRAYCYFCLSKYNEALSDFNQADELANSNIPLDFVVIKVSFLIHLGKKSEAISDINKVIKQIEKGNITISEHNSMYLLSILDLLDFEDSTFLDLSSKLLMRYPQSYRLLTIRAKHYLDKEENEKAYLDIQRALSFDSEYVMAKIALIDYYINTNKRMKAIEASEEYVEKYPDDLITLTCTAMYFNDIGMTIRAEQLFEQILKHPDINKPENADEKEEAETGLRQLKGRSHEINFDFGKGILN